MALVVAVASPGVSRGASSPDPSGCANHFYGGVDAWSPHEGWVVGARGRICGEYHGLIQRWNGDYWETVPSPQPGGVGGDVHLYAVAAVSADDAWAAGEYYPRGSGGSMSLLEHWDGTAWTQVDSASPNPQGVNRFLAVDAVAADDVWAIGYSCGGGAPAPAPGSAAVAGALPAGDRPPGCASLVERFDGHRWRVVHRGFADFVNAVAGPSADDVWAVGGVGTGHHEVAVVRRFDGQRWRQVYAASDHRDRYGTTLYSVAWLADDDVWAAGYGFDDHKVMLHWDGTSWQRVVMHGPGTIYGADPVSGSKAGGLWAVATNAQDLLLEHWDGDRWSWYPYGQQSHDAVLHGLTAKYPDFTWAVGETESGVDDRSLLLHWTGTKWVNERLH